ncbi:Hypothetical protein PHPALM_12275 [Phytophthora palmivora]|uniref:Uncharacterized protein n=1 Tax=Phytophthora palmivora TaxID=4796 RepID=A0A2P4Y052_9STRA|nr:Hypothetical protein PHPALM_12275 [Phytophthora palmivora]
MRSLDSPTAEVVIETPEQHESTPINNSIDGGGLHTGLGEVKHLMERLNVAQVKVKRLQRLEAALVDFFMEVMDRSSRGSSSIDSESAFARGKRKEQFLRKAEGDPISLLNALRTHLRLQFAEQEVQQAADERRALAENLNNQQKEEHTREKFQQLELTCRQLQEQQDSLIHQLNQHDQTQEITMLKEARDALIKAAQTHKPLDGTRTSGPSDVCTASNTPAPTGASPSHAKGDFFGTPAENQTLRRALRKYEVKMAQIEAANEERKREVQRLQQQLTGLRQSTQLQMYYRLEKESRHTQELADDLKRRLAESEADLLRTKGGLKERESQVQKMKDEYAKLFNAVQKQKQPTHYSPSKLTRTGATEATDTNVTLANSEHPYVVEYYRSEAARVERESEALKLQIRRMMASEQLHKQKTRVLRAEKQKLTQERDQLRADLDRAKKHNTLQSIAMNRQQTHSSVSTRKISSNNALQEIKQLKERNVFLEERFRKSLRSNSATATIGAVARLRGSLSISSGLDGPDPVEFPDHESDTEASEGEYQAPCISRQNSAVFTKTRPPSAHVTVTKDNEKSFRSLDAATLQSLQQVRRATRVRPQSANPIK